MTRRRWVYDENGDSFEVGNSSTDVNAPSIQQDTLETPLRHPVTGQMFDSKSAYMRECDRLGLKVVGNDLLSNQSHAVKDKITEAVIMDRIQRAEAIYSDPMKLSWRRKDNLERLERAKQLLKRY